MDRGKAKVVQRNKIKKKREGKVEEIVTEGKGESFATEGGNFGREGGDRGKKIMILADNE